MKTTNDILQKQQGETPNPRSTPSIIIGNANEESQPRGPVTISKAPESCATLPLVGGLLDVKEGSSKTPNNDSAGNSQPTFSGLANVNRTVKSLDSMQRAAKRGAARKKKEHQDNISFAGHSAISQDTVQTNDTSYTSPGAVSVQGIGSSSHHNSIDEAIGDNHEQADRGTDMENGPEDPDDLTPSLIVTARLVSENPLMPEFLEEHMERRIQEGVESRLRAHQHSEPPQHPIITTVVAEPMDPANVILHGANKVNAANPSETSSRKVCGLQLLVVLAVIVVVAVTWVIVARNQPTQSTTSAPNSQLLERLEPWIVRRDNDQDSALFQDPESPQYLALDWLSDDDTNLSEDRPTAFVLERYALAVLYYSTNGPFWVTQDYGFLSTTTVVCSWNNGTSADDPSARGVICGNMSSVEYILLEKEGLAGTIPWELSLLSDLLSLTLSGNKLRSSIPTELGQLTRLQELQLYSNQLEGPLPSEIGQATGLQMLWLDSNDLTGTLPTELGNLAALTYLSFTSNLFTGTLPTELGQLMNLVGIYVNNNALNGRVPTELGLLTQLQQIWLDHNTFTGTLSTELGQLINLVDFRVSNNKLNGRLPTELGLLTWSEYFWLENNTLTGTLPRELGQLTNLIELCVKNNKLNGTFPLELMQLTYLEVVWLDNNSLTGSLPTEFGQLINIVDLCVMDNKLNGTLPTELMQLTDLEVLWLDNNDLTGTLPTELGQVTNLIELFVQNNNFNGTVPTELGQLAALSTLWFQGNSLTGTIPTELGRLTLLEEFHAEMNGFTGAVPMVLSALSNLNNAWFHQNELTGSVNEIFCADARQWENLQSDCFPTSGKIEIECDCCTICCNTNGTNCQPTV